MPQLMNKQEPQAQDNFKILQSLMDMQKKNISPYQQGVDKALKQSGEQHALDAIKQGVPADYIIKEAGLHQDPTQLLASIISMGAQKPQESAPTQQPQMQPQSQQPTNVGSSINQQAADLTNPNHRTLMGNILNTLGNVTGVNAMNTAVDSVRLSNLAASQEIQGQKPLQVGDYQKEIIKQTTELAKQGNLQPEQLLNKFEIASQPFITQRDAYARISSLAQDPSPAGDLGLIFSYMKLLDPGSTVREGEQATAENARGVPDSLRNLYGKIMSGKKLTSDQRVDFLNRSKGIFKSAESQQKKTTEEFGKLGRKNGIDPSKFIRDTGLSQDATKENTTPTNTKIGRFQVRIM